MNTELEVVHQHLNSVKYKGQSMNRRWWRQSQASMKEEGDGKPAFQVLKVTTQHPF